MYSLEYNKLVQNFATRVHGGTVVYPGGFPNLSPSSSKKFPLYYLIVLEWSGMFYNVFEWFWRKFFNGGVSSWAEQQNIIWGD